jgi:hypothetical protein
VFNNDGLCLGIAFQSLKVDSKFPFIFCGNLNYWLTVYSIFKCICQQDSDTENIGYIIPTLVVNHFLTDFSRNSMLSFTQSHFQYFV